VRVDAYHVTSLEPFEFFSKGSIFGQHLVNEDTDNSEAPEKIYTAYPSAQIIILVKPSHCNASWKIVQIASKSVSLI